MLGLVVTWLIVDIVITWLINCGYSYYLIN